MTSVVSALLPIFLLIVLGWAFRATGFLGDSFWVPAEKLTYFFMFPALLLINLAEARLEGLPVGSLAGVQAGGVLVAAAVAVLLRPACRRLDGPGFSSLFQGMIRPNTYVGLAAAAGIFGAAGVTLTAICVAVVVPLVNLLSVLALLHWGKGERPAPTTSRSRAGEVALAVLKNPLIAACLLGAALNLSGIGMPALAAPFFRVLGGASLALGLLAVGAGLDLRALKGGGGWVLLSSLSKLAALPAIVWGLSRLAGLEGLALVAGVTYAALPCAPNAYVLARRMRGDAELMAGIISVQTMLAAATLPVVVALLSGP